MKIERDDEPVTPAVDLPVRIAGVRTLYKDSGPCASTACAKRADLRVRFLVGSVEVLTWVCDEHATDLGLPPRAEAVA